MLEFPRELFFFKLIILKYLFLFIYLAVLGLIYVARGIFLVTYEL